MTEDLVLCS